MTIPPPPPAHPRCRRPLLVQQDIQLSRHGDGAAAPVVATVECARRNCTVEVEACAQCAYFARIETHEAGYILLCRGDDPATLAPEPIGDEVDDDG